MGFSVLRIWRIFGSVGFLVFALIIIINGTAVFRFGALCGLRVFCTLVFSFMFLSMMAVFRIFLPNTFYGFPGSAKEVTPGSRGKTVTPKRSLTGRGMHDKPSLFSNPYPL